MVGYWDENTPLRCSSDSVKVTLYRGGERTIIALGNWGKTDQTVTLNVDFARLGFMQTPAFFRIPAIEEFQPHRVSTATCPEGAG